MDGCADNHYCGCGFIYACPLYRHGVHAQNRQREFTMKLKMQEGTKLSRTEATVKTIESILV